MAQTRNESSEVHGRGPHSQTLDRGIRVLELLADTGEALSIGRLATELGVHRSIVYRILRTLEDHHLVSRRVDGLCELGVGVSALARGVSRDLRSAATPELAAVANEFGMTCFLVVPAERDCVTLLSVEPRHTVATVAQRPGTRHRLDRGAPGLALLAGGPAQPGERPEVAEARSRGYARTQGEVIPGLTALAAPVLDGDRAAVAAIAVVFVETTVAEPTIGERLRQASEVIAADLV